MTRTPTQEEIRMARLTGTPLPEDITVPTTDRPVEQPEQVTATVTTQQRIQEQEAKQAQARQMLDSEELAMAQRYGMADQETVTEISKEIANRDQAIKLLKQVESAEVAISNAEKAIATGKFTDNGSIEQAKNRLAETKQIVEAITDPELAPFVRYDNQGKFLVNIDSALKAGIKEQLLYNAGATGNDLEAARNRISTGEKIEYLTEEESLRRAGIAEMEEKVFQRVNQKLPDGNYINKGVLEQIRADNPEAYNVLVKFGFEEANQYIDNKNRITEKRVKEYSEYLHDLAVIKPYADKNNPEQYDIVRILQSGNEPAIRAARNVFEPEVLNSANAYISGIKYANVSPEIILAGEKGSVLAQRIADYQAANKGVNWTAAMQLVRKELTKEQYDREYREFSNILKENSNQVQDLQRGRMVATVKALPDRLADAFVPFKATIQNWDNLSDLEKAGYLAGDVGLTILYAIGIGQALGIVRSATIPGTALSKAQQAARNAGKASAKLEAATAEIKGMALVRYPKTGILPRDLRAVNKVNDLQRASKAADTKFIDQLGRLTSANAADLKYLEKLSGMKGLKNAMTEASKAARNLEKAWNKIPEEIKVNRPVPANQAYETTKSGVTMFVNPDGSITPRMYNVKIKNPLRSGYYFMDMTPDDLYMRYQDLYKAQAAYDAVMEKLRGVVKVRFTEPPPPDVFAGYNITTPKTPKGSPKQDILDEMQKMVDEFNARTGTATSGKVKTITRTKISEVRQPVTIKRVYKPAPATTETGVIPDVVKTKLSIKAPVKPVTRQKKKVEYEGETKRRERLGTMTPEQLQRYYGVQDNISIRSKMVSDTGVRFDDLIYPQLTPMQVPGTIDKITTRSRDSLKDQLEEATKLEVKPITETALVTETGITTKTGEGMQFKPPEINLKIIPLLIPLGISGDDIRRILKKRLPVVWKQGFGWWIIEYPYRSKKDMRFEVKKPAGAFDVKGIGSAYRTLQALGGNPNILIRRDLGIVDVTVTGNKIKFTRKPVKKKKPAELIKRR